ncbi:MAG: ABC transporter permease [Melioribacteraceae bacterium]|nr:ABC transporter permease [Melioribacteraceae bacterium]MCF8355484.1 ABC transporter permease [Melioribacteraceae bacterium]MCF8394909.1 ABC transporter permease [Melioribacteraceae bacterium]MCF8420449.1 ABC transporter permease [Melioribacteraceae bacterium]
MRIFELFRIAFTSLNANKLRSTLTILGIVVGIFSIISISTVISMIQTSIEEGVSALGKNTFQIQKWPVVQMSSAERRKIIRNRKDITLEEFYRFKERLVEAKNVGGEQWSFGRVLKYNTNKTNPNIQLCGLTPEAFETNDWVVDQGREFNQRDVRSYERVIVLGADVAKTLFDYVNPIGQEIKVDGHKLLVIGVLESQGQIFGQSQDNFALIPITTWQSFYGKRGNSVNITITSHTRENYDRLIETAIGHMRAVRKVMPGEPNDFSIRSNEQMLTQINEMTAGVKIGAFVIAAIALLAAGVGIMNIMLVSVTERTKEIGIRKAIGAKKMNILVQFLVESVSLSVFGGIVGIVLGVLIGNFAGSFLDAKAVVPVDWIVIGVSLCVLIGVTFGTYPAYKASNLDPIDALRYE